MRKNSNSRLIFQHALTFPNDNSQAQNEESGDGENQRWNARHPSLLLANDTSSNGSTFPIAAAAAVVEVVHIMLV